MKEGSKKHKELEEKFVKILKERKFTVLEMAGFQARPELALLAGIAIGYQVAMSEKTKC